MIIGSSFIGWEITSCLLDSFKHAKITVIDMIDTPFSNVFGNEVGKSLKNFAESKGVEFKLNKKVVHCNKKIKRGS